METRTSRAEIIRHFLFYPALLIAIGVAPVLASTTESEGEKPNIIFCMADDLGWGDTGYNGHPLLKTPNLDEMARSGIRFDRFYAASPVCSPSRGSVLTGRHPYRYGVFSANVGHLRKEEVLLAEVLRDQGYATGHFGKWHLGTLEPGYSGKAQRKPEENYMTPGMSGFDEWFSTEYAVPTWNPTQGITRDYQRTREKWPSYYYHNGKRLEEDLEGEDSKIVMEHGISFIKKTVEKKTPFFAVIWFHAPHGPVIAGPDYRAMYSDRTEEEQHYFGVVTALDEQMGRLRRTLRDLGVAENTMLWFTSDNGPEGNPGKDGRSQGSAGGFRGRKRSLYEGGVRVPGLLEWPARIQDPRVVKMPCVTSDYFPTVLDVLGIDLPSRPYDGISLLPLIEGRMTERPQPIGFEFQDMATLVGNRYKLVHNPSRTRHRSDNGDVPAAEFELYDLIADPSETRNIAAEHPKIVEEMKQTLFEWQASCARSLRGEDYRDAHTK